MQLVCVGIACIAATALAILPPPNIADELITMLKPSEIPDA
jgi:hypothetical protein